MGNRQLIQRLYDAFAARDVPAMMGCLDATVEWTQAEGFPYAGTHVGPRAVLDNVWMPMGTEWRDWAATPETIIVQGHRVAAVGTYTGTYKATDRSMRARFAHVFEVRDGHHPDGAVRRQRQGE